MSDNLEPIEGIRGRTPAQVVEALSTLAACGGSADKAAERTGVSRSTLQLWRDKYPLRYAKAQDEFARELEETQNRFYREHINNLNDAEALALSVIVDQLNAGQIKDVPGTLQRLATVKGINVDKLRVMTDRPSVITESRSGADILRALRQKVGITAEVVEEESERSERAVPAIRAELARAKA